MSRLGNMAQAGTATLRPWRKGQSGNPKGRRALPNIREALVFLTCTDERLAAGRCVCSSLAARRGTPPTAYDADLVRPPSGSRLCVAARCSLTLDVRRFREGRAVGESVPALLLISLMRRVPLESARPRCRPSLF
jgi:hypothetical protein